MTPNTTNNSTKFIVVIIVALAIACAAYFILSFELLPKDDEVVVANDIEIGDTLNRADIRGYFYMNLRPIDSESFEKMYRVEDLGSTPILDSPLRDYTLQSNGGFAAYVYRPISTTYKNPAYMLEGPAAEFPQVQFLYRGTIEALGEADYRPITRSTSVNKRDPKWSPDNTHLVFASQQSGIPIPPPDEYINYDLYITDTKGNEKLVANGVHPNWSPDGQGVLYLKEDGLYHMSLDDTFNPGVESAVLNIPIYEDRIGRQSNIHVSRSGNYLVWTKPHLQTLDIYRITSQNPFTIELASTIHDVEAYTPLIAENDKYIAAYVYRYQSELKNELRVFDLEDSSKSLSITSFVDFEASYTKLTDWKMFWGNEHEYLENEYVPLF